MYGPAVAVVLLLKLMPTLSWLNAQAVSTAVANAEAEVVAEAVAEVAAAAEASMTLL